MAPSSSRSCSKSSSSPSSSRSCSKPCSRHSSKPWSKPSSRHSSRHSSKPWSSPRCRSSCSRPELQLLAVAVAAVALVAGSRPAAGGQLDTVTIQYTDPDTFRPLPPRPPAPPRPQGVTPHVAASGLRFGPLPCDCQGEEIGCGCCAGLSMSYLNWNRKACFNLTYDPYEFAFGVNLLMDGESVFKNSISGKNPPPACVPIPTPLPVLPVVDFCVRMFNVFTPPPGYNLHACMNFETRISRAPVLVLEFDCMRLGSSGVYLLKPEDYGEIPEPSSSPEPGEEGQEGSETYDEVTEDRRKNNATTARPTLSSLSSSSSSVAAAPEVAIARSWWH